MLNPKEVAVLKLISEDSAYENYFFNRVSDIKWFYPLKEKGYFNPNENTQPQEDKERRGYFSIPQWNVLPYLERVSQQVNIPGNEKYIEELLSIIREVTQYHIENNKILDNYRAWWYFVKFLLNLPNDKIPIDVIEMTRIWLDSKFDNMLSGSDIATKLLPKFLDGDDSEDWKKAERIAEIITDIRWFPLPEEGSLVLGKTEEPKTILESYWLEESFKVNAVKVGERCSEHIIFTLADRLKEILRREHEHWEHIEFDNKKYQISVKGLKDGEYQLSLGMLKAEDIASEKPGEELIRSLKAKPEKIFEFKLENCYVEDVFVNGAKQELIKNEVFTGLKDEFDEVLKDLYQRMFTDYSHIWFKSLYSEPTIHEAKQIVTVILRDIVLAKAKKDKDVAEKVLGKFLNSEYQYPLFKRIVLFVVGSEWDTYKELFWKMIDEDWGEEFFEEPDYEPEVYTLFQKNVGQFTPEEKQKIKTIINRGPQRYLPDKGKERYVALWKQKWYSALKTDPYFTPLYEEQKKITKIEEEVSFKRMETRMGPGPSPLSIEEILEMSNQELAEFLKTFKTKDSWKGPTAEGLADLLKMAVQEKPENFIDDLSPFLNTGYHYIYEILWGIRDAWNEKKTIEWGKLFEFIKQYINRDDFWGDKFKVEGDPWPVTHLWVTGMVGELVQAGTEDDSWAFSEEYFDTAKETLFLILDKQKVEEKEEISDAVTYALNSSFGKVITALIYLALRIARVEDKKGQKKEVKWAADIKSKYENILQRGIIESFILLGQYLPNFYYLDKEWVETQIKNILQVKDKMLWEAFMSSYLFGRVNEDLYKLMRQHYSAASDYDFKEKDVAEHLIQHVCIGYLSGNESIENEESLFKKVLDKWDHSQISEIIGFFWMQRDYPDENIRERIISFWRWVYENEYKDKQKEELSDEDKKALSNLSKFTIFLPKIDSENFNWLMLSAPYIHSEFNYPFFIEYLDKFGGKGSIGYIGKIVVLMSSSAPTLSEYKQEHMQSVVEKLYKTGNKEAADEICNIYGSRGFDFLRDIYNRYNQ